MRHGLSILNFLKINQEAIKSIIINGNPVTGFLKLELTDGSEKIFSRWDEEDQGLFACALQGETWDPSKRGIPSTLTVFSSSEKMVISSDKKLNIIINQKPVEQWGEPVKLSEHSSLWKKRVVAESSAQGAQQATFCGMKKGFLG